MTDRLPMPLTDGGPHALAERASATSARAGTLQPTSHGEVRARAASPGVSLRDVQVWMVGAITGSEADAAAADQVLTPGPRLDARERFEIYRAGYRSRLVECLEGDYPILAQTLGEAEFGLLCGRYIDRHPSTSPNLNGFGRHMASFCLEDPGASTFASEVATIEWAIVGAVHAATPPGLDLVALQAIPAEAWGSARLVRGESVRLFRFTHPVNTYYQACLNQATRPHLPAPEPTATVVYRQDRTIWRMDLTPAMTRVLDALLEQQTLAEALGTISLEALDADAHAEAERSVMVWFREWVKAGFFAEVRIAQ